MTESLKVFIKNKAAFLKRIYGALNRYGFSVFLSMAFYRLKRQMLGGSYSRLSQKAEGEAFKNEALGLKPLISFVVPVYNVEEYQLRECIESVLNQTCDNFELVLTDDASTMAGVGKVLREYEGRSNVRVIFREKNGNISLCTNTGIDAAAGEFVALLDCDDTLAPNAVYEVTRLLNQSPELDFIYTDEDKLDNKGGRRSFPNYKPDFSPDTLMSFMYTCHLGVYRRSLLKELGGLREGFEGAQDYDLVVRLCEKTDKIGHIPRVLYHWRKRPQSTAAKSYSKDYSKAAAYRLKAEALKRRGIKGRIEEAEGTGQLRVVYTPPKGALISIIIPSKDNYEVLKRCILSIKEKTEYKSYEIIVVDNGSAAETRKEISKLCGETGAFYHYEKFDFNFSKMCNIGAGLSRGGFLLFLNDDTEVKDGGWLERMAGHAALPRTGAVGAKLLYPKTTLIQHDGIINLPVGPSHALSHTDDKPVFDFGRNRLDYNYIAVTGACLCIERKKFDEVGGFFEGLPVGYNDVDLCFKLYEGGYYNVVRNDCVLYHYESLSRGDDDKNAQKLKRLEAEREILFKRHPKLRGRDPYHNINLAKNRLDFEADYKRLGGKVYTLNAEGAYTGDRIRGRLYNVFDGDVIDIRGEVFYEGALTDAFWKRQLLLRSYDGGLTAFDTDVYFEPTLNQTKKKNRGGFCCYIEKASLNRGKYRLGAMITSPVLKKKAVIMFDYEIDV